MQYHTSIPPYLHSVVRLVAENHQQNSTTTDQTTDHGPQLTADSLTRWQRSPWIIINTKYESENHAPSGRGRGRGRGGAISNLHPTVLRSRVENFHHVQRPFLDSLSPTATILLCLQRCVVGSSPPKAQNSKLQQTEVSTPPRSRAMKDWRHVCDRKRV